MRLPTTEESKCHLYDQGVCQNKAHRSEQLTFIQTLFEKNFTIYIVNNITFVNIYRIFITGQNE